MRAGPLALMTQEFVLWWWWRWRRPWRVLPRPGPGRSRLAPPRSSTSEAAGFYSGEGRRPRPAHRRLTFCSGTALVLSGRSETVYQEGLGQQVIHYIPHYPTTHTLNTRHHICTRCSLNSYLLSDVTFQSRTPIHYSIRRPTHDRQHSLPTNTIPCRSCNVT
ncbi:hypothetical protein Pmani_038065 [Petrolisthes manimaculis]|uniref:Uncharacterized protein n=1 Tax=Petrolisthes manimaculis TaxID=1843537 RepID=A0AAE1NH46_9EUCA|nr:hypothetical protein Pmani_038065 [Petrolisthes manimaculis]